jgi:hypothetical protein
MASSTLVPVDDVILSEFAVNDVEAALALSFITNEYRTGNSETTFADAFTGTSPKLTYSTSAGSNSTMVNSEGKIVWAPHNLIMNSEDFRASGPSSPWVHQNGASITENALTAPDGSSNGTQLDLSASTGSQIRHDHNLSSSLVADLIFRVWVRCANGTTEKVRLQSYSAVDGTQVSNDLSVSDTWTPVDLDFSKSSGAATSVYIKNATDGAARTIYAWGAHVYRSDLGGMAPVPGADTGFETYVPTNGNAEYLPRVGHHVYNGSTWVNEGLLIESEPRTNLVTQSTPQSGDLDKSGGSFSYVTCNFTPLSGPGIHFDTSGVTSYTYFTPTYTAADYTLSVFVEMDDGNAPAFSSVTSGSATDFCLLAEESAINPLTYDVEHYGGSTYRISATVASTSTTVKNAGILKYSGNSTRTFKVTGFQFELGSTPSSYMPTNGGTYTRTAQSLTVPPAQFGWPEPEYIGPELVDNGGFDTAGLTDWSDGGSTGGWTIDGGGTAVFSGGTPGTIEQSVTTTIGAVYEINYTMSSDTTVSLRWGGSAWGFPSTAGTYTHIAVANAATTLVGVYSGVAATTIDNISVREINPLSVSIQMDGRMTYADEGNTFTGRFYEWTEGTDQMYVLLDTGGGRTGAAQFRQNDAGVIDVVISGDGAYSPGINVPFNISSRHGSTFINGAVDGVALTEDTTPTAIPDLSGTNLQIAYDFMGTIGTFRQFAGDIGDTGLVTATNPSTEPTLSLTFDGTGGSFYNLNWSE